MTNESVIIFLAVLLILAAAVVTLVAIDRSRHRAIARTGLHVNISIAAQNERLTAALLDSIDNTRTAMALNAEATEAIRLIEQTRAAAS